MSDQCEFDDDGFLTKGLCSNTTQTLLSDPQNCINPIFNLTERIFDSVRCLVNSMCDRETWQNLEPVPITKRVPAMKLLKDNQEDKRFHRLIPLEQIQEYFVIISFDPFNISSVLLVPYPPLENTRHRYPWICSLRSVDQPSHICGVTLLSRPPGPTVLVTSAHCVYICKSEEGRLVPNCCYPNVFVLTRRTVAPTLRLWR